MHAIILMGPTAVGKSKIALELAKNLPIEIISVDSALVYKDMDIGSAKPTSIELSLVPHHLINIIDPLQNYSVANFITDSTKLVKEINQRNKIPLLVGGTMMYFNSLINGLSKLPEADITIRQTLEQEINNFGLFKLYEKLQKIDIASASKIMPNDKQRIMRAIEVYEITKTPISKLQQSSKTMPLAKINYLSLAITPSCRKSLYETINLRFKQMLKDNFIEEVLFLQNKYLSLTKNHTSMRSVGYREVWQYLAHEINYNELVENASTATRNLAKRQITWLKSFAAISIESNDFTKIYKNCQKFIETYSISL